MEPKTRTWLSTILFMDIVGYSKLPVDQQMEVKHHFGSLVANAVRGLTQADCITIDAGDAVAICYVGDPEDMLYVAIGLRDAFAKLHEELDPHVHYGVRSGMNLGPVKIVEDINGQRNAVGDGINVAQRIMSFATPNQLLVSRAYFDVVNCLSEEFRRLFEYRGMHKDKHVRRHAIYEVLSGRAGIGHDDDESSGAQPLGTEAVAATTPPDLPSSDTATSHIDQEALASLEHRLALYIGPMAKVVVRRASRRCRSFDEVWQRVAKEIPTEEERREFLAKLKD
jgi:class 3 adenylate cyclase